MHSDKIEQILNLVESNETAEQREADLREAARLLEIQLRSARAMEGIDHIAATKSGMSRVETRHWTPDDEYLVVKEFQVYEQDGFHAGDSVEVTVRNMQHREGEDGNESRI